MNVHGSFFIQMIFFILNRICQVFFARISTWWIACLASNLHIFYIQQVLQLTRIAFFEFLLDIWPPKVHKIKFAFFFAFSATHYQGSMLHFPVCSSQGQLMTSAPPRVSGHTPPPFFQTRSGASRGNQKFFPPLFAGWDDNFGVAQFSRRSFFSGS